MGNDERARLKTLMKYWVEHNREHSQEIRDWATKARTLGEIKVAEEMSRAAQAMDKASGLLAGALERLEAK